jgi:cystathionine beta-lyase/cystathionine gamma-synthase
MKKLSFKTLAIHTGEEPDPGMGAIRLPLYMSDSFKLPDFGPELFNALTLVTDRPAHHLYSRWTNPTLRSLEDRLAALEGGEAGLVFASGMAAISSILLTLLSKGDHLIASDVCYMGSLELFGSHLPRWGIQTSLVNTSNLKEVRAAIQPNTKIIFLETPANPVLRIADIAAIAEIAHSAGALLVVDSTFATPALQRPLELGADYVVHSLTKYLSGHGDALGGVLLGKKKGLHQIRQAGLIHLGGALSPFNAWLIMRGLMTLPLRMEQHCKNALEIARFLESHSAISRVIYPGLESHPHYELAKRQMVGGFGGMVSFQLKGGIGAAVSFAEKIHLFVYATSLGHLRSMIYFFPTDTFLNPPFPMTRAQRAGILEWMGKDGVVRLNIGLEDANDLIADLDQALQGRTFKGLIAPLAYRTLSRQHGLAAADTLEETQQPEDIPATLSLPEKPDQGFD